MASAGNGENVVSPPEPTRVSASTLSDEEKAVLKECESESFFRRALPLSCASIAVVNLMIKSVAAGISYFIGKASYIPICRKKILDRIPDSQIANAITKGQNRHNQDQRIQQEPPMLPKADERDDYRAFKNSPPTDSPSYEGLNDSKRPSMDNEVKMPDNPSEEKKSTTYEDLRKKNRQEYKDSASAPTPSNPPGVPSYKDSPYMPQKTWPDKNTPPQEPPEQKPPQTAPKRKRTNMWGDEIDD